MRRHHYIGLGVVLAMTAMVVWGWASPKDHSIKLGHVGGPMLAPLYLAKGKDLFAADGRKVEIKRFGTAADVGYALLSGRIDAAFLEPSTAYRLLNEHDLANIKVSGAIRFPYGATVVVRKGLDLRLVDLEGRKVAAGSSSCRLLTDFRQDAERHGVNTKEINFVYLDFSLMLPALEAGEVDAIVTRSSLTLPAQKAGHHVLYQNWDVQVQEDDICCPSYLAHVKYFLLVKGLEDRDVTMIDSVLRRASDKPITELRRAVIEATGFDLPRNFPVPHYSGLGEDPERELGKWAWRSQ